MNCSACGKNLMIKTKQGGQLNVIAFQLSVSPQAEADQVLAPYETREYFICFPCYLKAFGIPLPMNDICP